VRGGLKRDRFVGSTVLAAAMEQFEQPAGVDGVHRSPVSVPKALKMTQLDGFRGPGTRSSGHVFVSHLVPFRVGSRYPPLLHAAG
jgi:hypothetical protein